MSFVGLSHFNRFDGLGRFGRFYGFDDSLRLFDRLRRLNLGFHLFQNFDRNLRKRFRPHDWHGGRRDNGRDFSRSSFRRNLRFDLNERFCGLNTRSGCFGLNLGLHCFCARLAAAAGTSGFLFRCGFIRCGDSICKGAVNCFRNSIGLRFNLHERFRSRRPGRLSSFSKSLSGISRFRRFRFGGCIRAFSGFAFSAAAAAAAAGAAATRTIGSIALGSFICFRRLQAFLTIGSFSLLDFGNCSFRSFSSGRFGRFGCFGRFRSGRCFSRFIGRAAALTTAAGAALFILRLLGGRGFSLYRFSHHSIHILTRSCFGSGKFRVDGRLRQGEFFRRDIRRLLLSRLAAAAAVFALLPIGTFDAFGTFSPFCTLRALVARTFLTFRLLSLLCSFLSFQTIRAFESFSASSTAAVAAFLTVTASAACTAPFVGSAVTILFLRRLIRLG